MIDIVQLPPEQNMSWVAESATPPATLPMSLVIPLEQELGPALKVPLQTW